MGEIAPPAILHSIDINRSSQDTQQLRASQTEPVRHGAGGGSTTRHNSLQPGVRKGCRAKNPDCHRIFAYLCEEPHEVNHLTTNTALHADIRLDLIVLNRLKFRTVPVDPSPMSDRLLIPNFYCPVSAGPFIINHLNPWRQLRTPGDILLPPPPPPPPLPPPPPPVDPGRTPQITADSTHPLAGKLMQSVGSKEETQRSLPSLFLAPGSHSVWAKRR